MAVQSSGWTIVRFDSTSDIGFIRLDGVLNCPWLGIINIIVYYIILYIYIIYTIQVQYILISIELWYKNTIWSLISHCDIDIDLLNDTFHIDVHDHWLLWYSLGYRSIVLRSIDILLINGGKTMS